MTVVIETKAVGALTSSAQLKTIDWNDSSDRKWLMNHMHHCMMNQKQVTLFPR